MARVCFRKRKPGVEGKSGMQKCGLPDWRGVSANKSLAKAGAAAQWQACARPWVLSLALQKKPGKSSSFTKVLRYQGIDPVSAHEHYPWFWICFLCRVWKS